MRPGGIDGEGLADIQVGKRGAPDGVLASARRNASGLLRRRTKKTSATSDKKGVRLKDSKRTLFGLGNAEFPSPEGPAYFRVDSSASRTACFWRAEVCTLGRRASQ